PSAAAPTALRLVASQVACALALARAGGALTPPPSTAGMQMLVTASLKASPAASGDSDGDIASRCAWAGDDAKRQRAPRTARRCTSSPVMNAIGRTLSP